MAKTLQFRRATTANLASVTGAVGEIFIDTTKDTVVVMDGSTAGGHPLAKEGAGGSTGDFVFSANTVSISDNASITVTANVVANTTVSSSGGMNWSETNSFVGTYTSSSPGYSNFTSFDGETVIFFDNVMSDALRAALNATTIGDTILINDSPPYTVTLTSVFSSFMGGQFIANVTSAVTSSVTNEITTTRYYTETSQFQLRGSGLVAPKVTATNTLVIPSYTRSQVGFGNNTVAGTNGAIISVSDSDGETGAILAYYGKNMIAFWNPDFNTNPAGGQQAGAWLYTHGELVSQP